MTATEEIAASQQRLNTPKPPPPAPSPEKPKPESPPSDDLDAGMAHFRKVMLDGMPEKKREAVKPEPPAKPEKKAAAAPAAETSQEPEKKPVKVTRRDAPPARSIEDVAAEAAARTVAAMRPATPQQEPPKVDAPIPKEYAKQLAVFTEMAEDSPERHGDLPDKLRKFVQKEDTYIQKWLEENPGSDFDSNAEVHNDFYRRNEPAYDADDYDEAKTKLAAMPLLEKESQKIRSEMGDRLKRVDEIEAKEAERELVPKIAAEQKAVMAAILGAVNPDYAALAEQPQEIEKLSQEDPSAYELILESAKHTLPFVSEVVKLWDSNSKIKANMENPLHRHIYDYERFVADRLKSLPESDQINQNGQRFASWSEYQSLSPAEQKKRWIIGRDELIFARQNDAKDAISRIVRLASGLSKRNGKGTLAARPPQTAEPKAEPERLAAKAETTSPSMPGKTIISTTGDAGVKTGDNWADVFNKTLAGRRF